MQNFCVSGLAAVEPWHLRHSIWSFASQLLYRSGYVGGYFGPHKAHRTQGPEKYNNGEPHENRTDTASGLL